MRKHVMPYAKYILLVLGGAFIVAGALAGGYTQVLMKAVRICLECIGIG